MDRMSREKALSMGLPWQALNAKVTVITVTEPIYIDYGGGHVPRRKRWIALTQLARQMRAEVLDEVRSMTEQIGISAELLQRSECTPSHCDCRSSKIQRLRLDRHGYSRASRPQEAVFGQPNI
jgi:hypothetical protein